MTAYELISDQGTMLIPYTSIKSAYVRKLVNSLKNNSKMKLFETRISSDKRITITRIH